MATGLEVKQQLQTLYNGWSQVASELEAVILELEAINPTSSDATAQIDALNVRSKEIATRFNETVKLDHAVVPELNALPNDEFKLELSNQYNNFIKPLGGSGGTIPGLFNKVREVGKAVRANIAAGAAPSTPSTTPGTPTTQETAADNLPSSGPAPTPPTNNTQVATTNPQTPSPNADDQTITVNKEEVVAKLRPNPLHAYPSYTYGISLHLLTVDDYNNIVTKKEYVAKNVLIASAGRYNNVSEGAGAFKRNPHFDLDFFFDNLKITSMIGIGQSNRSTNALDISFNIIEPYGMTFLDRLLVASAELQLGNYLENAYLLQIDFFGTDELGNIIHPIPNITKRIPIKLLQVKCKVSTRGSEWAVDAIAFNHQAFSETTVTTPINLEIKADKIREFFEATTPDAASQISKLSGGTSTNPERDPGNTVDTGAVNERKVYKATSLADALNEYQADLESKNKILYGDRYDFRFAPEIGEVKLWEGDQRNSPSGTPMADVNTTASVRKGNLGSASAALDYSKKILSINYGASVESVIDLLVRNSQYILKQLAVPDQQTNAQAYQAKINENKDKPLMWYKIVPTVLLTNYDFFNNRYGKHIIYNVLPYETYNSRLQEAPQGKAKRLDARKQYYYIYTGENTDIINLDIEFNAMYYTAKTGYKTNNMSLSGVDTYLDTGTECQALPPPAVHVLQPERSVVKLADQTKVGTGGARTATEVTANDVAASLATSSIADMLNVHMTIVGDPDFIKQDDFYFSNTYDSKGYVALDSRTVTDNGSIITDRSEVFVTLDFKTPTDIDDETGLMAFDTRYRASGFTGIYRVLKVSSTFENGKFTQVLDLIRYPNQDVELLIMSGDSSENRTPDQPSNPLGQVGSNVVGSDTERTSADIANLNGPAKEIPPTETQEKPFQDAVRGATFPVDSVNNPFAGLPSAPTDNSLNAGRSVLGGGG